MNDGEHTERLKDTCMDLFRQKKYKEALECFDRVLKIDPDDFLSLRQKGILLSYPEIPDKNAYLIAMEYLNRALDHRPGDCRTLQQKAEVASKLKKWDQAIDIYEELLERNPRNWRCWRGKGIAYADSGQPEKAIKCFDKAIELNKRDAISLRRKGVALSFMGKDEEAVTWFDKALNIPHRRRYNTLRDMGVSLVRLGRFSEAMIYLDKAVKENPQDGHAWREKGILLSQHDKDEEAILCFNRALEINPCDFDSLRQKAVSLFKLERDREALRTLKEEDELLSSFADKVEDYRRYREEAIYQMEVDGEHAEELLRRALAINPSDALTHLHFARLYENKELEKEAVQEYGVFKEHAKTYQEKKFINAVDKKIEILKEKLKETTSPDPIRQVLRAVEENIGDIERLYTKIEKIEKEFEQFLHSGKTIPHESPSFFVVLRKWNSYTPILPSKRGDNKGGGYFLYHRGCGIAIDPGFNFIENFYQEGFTIDDIDAILITHAHADHTADFIPLLTLFYERNIIASKKGKEPKKVHLLLNLGADRKFPFLDPRLFQQIHDPIIFDPGTEPLKFPPEHDVMDIAAVRADHTDIVSHTTCLGYLIDLRVAKIGLTGDTAWKVDRHTSGNLEEYIPPIAQFFRERNPDIMVVHIGSVHRKEFSFTEKKSDKEKMECFDRNHLGILGTALFLNAIKTKIVIVSEFGEELRECRQEIVEGLKKGLSLPCCLAGDIGLYVQPHDLTVLATYPRNRFISCTEIACTVPPGGSTICYHEKAVDIESLSPHELAALNRALEQKPKKPLSKRIYY